MDTAWSTVNCLLVFVCVCVCVSDLDAFVLETLTLCPNVIIYMFL